MIIICQKLSASQRMSTASWYLVASPVRPDFSSIVASLSTQRWKARIGKEEDGAQCPLIGLNHSHWWLVNCHSDGACEITGFLVYWCWSSENMSPLMRRWWWPYSQQICQQLRSHRCFMRTFELAKCIQKLIFHSSLWEMGGVVDDNKDCVLRNVYWGTFSASFWLNLSSSKCQKACLTCWSLCQVDSVIVCWNRDRDLASPGHTQDSVHTCSLFFHQAASAQRTHSVHNSQWTLLQTKT